ncbi:MAG: respiratory nitrate reductase subunit gamma [Notoacmeibacter sp.]|nr:respiratory nitrate reductase subunit gamma [Notoacmeibacter sp.]
MLTMAYALLFYVATLVLVAGLGYRIWQYAATPAPLKIPTTPAPVTRSGVVVRMAREVLVFESLFKSNKWIWAFGFLFHAALAVVLLRHFRYFQQPVWTVIALVQPFGVYAGFAMVAGLVGLWVRRIIVPRVRYISAPSDHLMLLLLVLIGASGLAMKFVAHTDIVAVKAFFLGLMRFDIQPLPADAPLLIHLGLVALLMIIFPFSKLLHAPGVFFSPTRNQVDNPRERRHLAKWAARLETGRVDKA